MYNFATGERTNRARDKFETMIAEGKTKATTALQKVIDEQPKDFIVPASGLTFDWDDAGKAYRMKHSKPDGFPLHRHALQQVADRAGVPWKFLDGLTQRREDQTDAPWGAELAAHTLNEIMRRQTKSRFLVRTVMDQVRGVLSDRFRRLDTAPIVEAFAQKTQQYGAVPIQAYALDTRFYIRSVLPGVFEPSDGEFILQGIELFNSDYGDGAFGLKVFFLRVLCVNGMIGDDMLRKIHLGGRLDESIEFSGETYLQDTKTIISATRDVVDHALAPDHVHARLDAVSVARNKVIDAPSLLESLRKASKMTKEEMKGITDKYNSAEVELMPPGNNLWRLSNAISLFAQSADAYRARDLEVLAGEVAGLAS
jgi:hypothetical protein